VSSAAVASIPAPDIPVPAGARQTRARRMLRALERSFAILGIVLLIYEIGFRIDVMTSGSMSPTLQGNGKAGSDWVVSELFSHMVRKPRRWELVAFRNEEGLQIMKRVVGLPSESVEMTKDGIVLINGSPVERPASLAKIEYLPMGTLAVGKTVQTGTGYVVLGDFSRDSQDSRWERPLEREAMNGRPWLIVWPLSRFGFVNP
jgi:signal peptidase I